MAQPAWMLKVPRQALLLVGTPFYTLTPLPFNPSCSSLPPAPFLSPQPPAGPRLLHVQGGAGGQGELPHRGHGRRHRGPLLPPRQARRAAWLSCACSLGCVGGGPRGAAALHVGLRHRGRLLPPRQAREGHWAGRIPWFVCRRASAGEVPSIAAARAQAPNCVRRPWAPMPGLPWRAPHIPPGTPIHSRSAGLSRSCARRRPARRA